MRLAETSGQLLMDQTSEEAVQTMSHELAHGIACHGAGGQQLGDNGIADGHCQAFVGWLWVLQFSINNFVAWRSDLEICHKDVVESAA